MEVQEFMNIVIDKQLETLNIEFSKLYERISFLEDENKKLKSEIFEKEYVNNLIEENKRLKKDYYRGFPISEEENDKIKEFISKYKSNDYGAIGGAFEYSFRPTGIGTIGKIIGPNDNELIFRDLD